MTSCSGKCMLACIAALFLVGTMSCSDDALPIARLSDADSTVVNSALIRAITDSATLANTTFSLPVVLETSFGEDDTSVTVVESFRLTKRPGVDFA
ncbi:MAG: hypothetical protein H7X80_04450, partial [bacterium]|nr:hypothetical protein [Candidatus Kapabacteria bacterium]